MEKKKILVIEDEKHIAEGLRLNLSLQNFDVKVAFDGVQGIELWKQFNPDLIVLDLMLPRLDGNSVLDKIRENDERIPILVLSAKDATAVKVQCLNSGVDDYLSKPFHLEEFLLRVKRLLTRASWNQHEDDSSSSITTYQFGSNRIDFQKLLAYSQQGQIQLTDQECKVLKIFINNKGKPLSRKDLLVGGWGYDKDTTTRTVDNFIVRFRKYFEENPKTPMFFKSIRSVGYVFDHLEQ